MPDSKATFRPARPSDIDLIAQLVSEYYEFEGLPFDEGAVRNAVQMLLEDGSLGRLWLIEDQGQAVGYVVLTLSFSLEYKGRDAFVDELYIRESHRGKGIGDKALKLLEDTCRSLGIRALHLEVEHDNVEAQRFYRKAGFEDHSRYLMTRLLPP